MRITAALLAIVLLQNSNLWGQELDAGKKAEVQVQIDGNAKLAIRTLRRAIALADRGGVAELEKKLVAVLVREGLVTEARAVAAKLAADQGPAAAWSKRWLKALGTTETASSEEDHLMGILRVFETKGPNDPAARHAVDFIYKLGEDSDESLAQAIPNLSPIGIGGALSVISGRLERPVFIPMIMKLCRSEVAVTRHIVSVHLEEFKYEYAKPHLPELLQHSDLTVVAATFEFLSGLAYDSPKIITELSEPIIEAAKRCIAAKDDQIQSQGMMALGFESLRRNPLLPAILEPSMKRMNPTDLEASAVEIWMESHAKESDQESVWQMYKDSHPWVQIAMLGWSSERTLGATKKMIAEALKKKDHEISVLAAAGRTRLPLSDQDLKKIFLAETNPRKRLKRIAYIDRQINDDLAAAVLRNIRSIDVHSRQAPNVRKWSVVEARKYTKSHIEFLVKRNPDFVFAHTFQIMRSSGRELSALPVTHQSRRAILGFITTHYIELGLFLSEGSPRLFDSKQFH